MTLIDNAGRVLRKAWSVRFMLLASLLSGVEAITAFIRPSQPTAWWALFVFFVTALALLSRFVAQKELHDE